MAEEMGYQSKLYIGTAGSTAATQVTTAIDVNCSLKQERGATTNRGDGTTIPIQTQNVTQRKADISWNMEDNPSDSNLTTLLTAAKTGAAIAVKITNASGTVKYDGDCTLDYDFKGPLAGESDYGFSAMPTKSAGRAPTLG